VLGIFAKDPNSMPVKTRLRLQPAAASSLYCACLADTIETACTVVARPALFLAIGQGLGFDDAVAGLRLRLLEVGLERRVLKRLRLEPQYGLDLGDRLENAFDRLGNGAFILGSDSPSLPPTQLERCIRMFKELTDVDLALGPTPDGGFYLIACRRPPRNVLREIAWSTNRTLADTQRRAELAGLRVHLFESWSDLDVPADLEALRQEIVRLRSAGDQRVARHVDRVSQALRLW
jgi:hypothetical protein